MRFLRACHAPGLDPARFVRRSFRLLFECLSLVFRRQQVRPLDEGRRFIFGPVRQEIVVE
jgi:hypothetical protein